MIIETDVIYDTDVIEELLFMNDLEETQAPPDIYSGVLLQDGIPYDIWAIRWDPRQEWGNLNPSYFGMSKSVHEYWSTANGACLYNAEPFQKGLKFNSFSKLHNKHDCDTAVLCEDFRRMGYDKVYINHDLYLYHERPKIEGAEK